MIFESHFRYCKLFHYLYLKINQCHLRSQRQRSELLLATTELLLATSELLLVSYYCHCRIRPEGLLCHAERDLLAIAKFLLNNPSNR